MILKANLSIVALGLLLGACASAPHSQWDKDGVSNYQRDSDQSACAYQIKTNKVSNKKADELMNLCMQGKGYRQTPES